MPPAGVEGVDAQQYKRPEPLSPRTWKPHALPALSATPACSLYALRSLHACGTLLLQSQRTSSPDYSPTPKIDYRERF
jgi:hypothetical protein